MEECCSGKGWALKFIVLGIILVLVRKYTAWDIWIVLGILAMIKGLILLIMPMCSKKQTDKPIKKK